MVKDIEKEFFKAFELFGILDECFSWMADEYDLGGYPTKPKAQWHKNKVTIHNLQQQEIIDRAEKFDDRVISFSGYHITDAPLMVEISNNLDECKGDERATERYIYDLLTPFKKYSDIMHPKAVIERYQAGIEKYKKDLQIWEQEPEKPENKTQIEAGKDLIKGLQDQIERAKDVANKYREILNEMWDKTGTVEYYLDYFIRLIGRYGIALDVLLLKRGINLLYYQQECGIYIEHRDITYIESYLGGMKLAQKYSDEALPKLTGEQEHPDDEIVLPDELSTPEAIDMLNELIKAGYCDEKYNWNSDKWEYKRDVMALACFAVEATKYLNLKRLKYVERKTGKEKDATQWNVFEKLFNYRGKQEGKNQLKSKRDIYMRVSDIFDPPEMTVIKAFFKKLENTKD